MTLADPAPGPHFFTKRLVEYNGKVPFIVTDLIKEMKVLDSGKIEGIFRISAQKSTVENLCLLLDRNRVKNWQGYEDPHIIAGALKRYIRELSGLDPLIGEDIYDKINTAMQCSTSDETLFTELHNLVSQGCPTRRNTLAYLMHYFNVITTEVEFNKMDASNLSIVFAPSLYPRTDSVASGSSMKAIEVMIKDFDKIFDAEWYGPNVEMTDEDIERSSEPEIDESDAALESVRRQLISKSLMKLDRENLVSILGLQRPDRKPPQIEMEE
ncbi:RhoGAP domain containing protein [Histomonas meleagridis]|uniref:RhoGAP domain containing protein n=1 Tax=Histomonas meleagridis TaxID=135588 RepID=UPI0035596E7E|nr:RhoGAP domain containing protein [Histomonas meleagridis]KAH0796296.1 RhoGAP domain containing protein [Histomonas meleagridis]